MESLAQRRVFAVEFQDLRLWSVGSYFNINWQWPFEYIKPLSTALKQREEEVDKEKHSFETLQLVTLHFDGSIEPRDLHGQDEFKGKLYFARTGDVIYSKIDVRNGAIGIVPEDMPLIAVSSEFPVYEVLLDVAVPQYIQLLFRTKYFRQAINSMISGTSGRKRVQPSQILKIEVPLPPRSVQNAISAHWQKTQEELELAKIALQKVSEDLNALLISQCSGKELLKNPQLFVKWSNISAWDTKSTRANSFRISNPTFKPLGVFAEEATVLAKPWEKPEDDWPVYGVNNKEGVFFSHHQKGKYFNASYKYIHKDWFFHNPTRSAVGSLGIVPCVPDNALTSPEYQVWRIREGLLPGYVAVLITTPYFIDLIRLHRVGAVKQRLYVDNLLQIPIPILSGEEQQRISNAREIALKRIDAAKRKIAATETEVEALILGSIKLETLEMVL